MCLFLQQGMRNTSQVCSPWHPAQWTVLALGYNRERTWQAFSLFYRVTSWSRTKLFLLLYIPIFVWARTAFGLPAYSWYPAEGRKHAWSETLFLLVIKFIIKLSFLILQLYLHVLPCTFLKSTSSHAHPICKHEYLLQMKGNLTETGEGKGSISALHRSKDA